MNKSLKRNKYILVVLIILNAIVLLGQIWPEGAPPFARYMNIAFLVLSLFFFASVLLKPGKQ